MWRLRIVCPSQEPSPHKQQIFGRSVNANTKKNVSGVHSRRGDQGTDKVPGLFVPGDEADIRVKWQEKIFGPNDIVTLSSAQRSGGKPQQRRTLPRLEVRRRATRSAYGSSARWLSAPLCCGDISAVGFSGASWYRAEIDRQCG